jgi:nitroreductase
MELTEAINTRRSIRRFSSEPVSEETIKELLHAAMQAPSARNEQPWHFVVITERKTLDAIAEGHPHAKMLHEAPVAVAVCGELSSDTNRRYWMLDCACATQNLLLSAHTQGLGGVWVAVYPREERIMLLSELLGLPSHVVPLNVIPLGYPAERKEPSERFDPEKIHFGRF